MLPQKIGNHSNKIIEPNHFNTLKPYSQFVSQYHKKYLKQLFILLTIMINFSYICHGTLEIIYFKSTAMKSITNRTDRLKAYMKNSLAENSFSQPNIFKRISRQNKEQSTLMEMWDYYLTFTKLEF